MVILPQPIQANIPAYRDYKEVMNEYIVPQSTAKYAKHARESYMVGALARFNLNSHQLHPVAQEVASYVWVKTNQLQSVHEHHCPTCGIFS